MEWDAIQRDAKSKGYLVFAIDQAQTPALTQPGPWGSAFDGYCVGLAANWMALAYQGSDFPLVGDVCDNPPWQSTMAQNLQDAMNNQDDWQGCWKVAMEPFQCAVSHGLKAERHGKPTSAFLWSIMSQAYGCYGIIMRKVHGGGHAIALRHSHGSRYHLFDSNYYHVCVQGADAFKTFLAHHLSVTGYHDKYNKLTGIAGITPPVGS